MRVTLKKFADNPYPLIKKAPVIITINREPRYAVVPYIVYKATFEKTEHTAVHQNTVTQHMQTNPPKRHWFLKLLFD